jgi:uncharacterized protein YbdZ (MbtH family)
MEAVMDEPAGTWMVIANCEDECAVWAAVRPVPLTWRRVGLEGDRAACEAFIERLDAEKNAAAVRKQCERGMVVP